MAKPNSQVEKIYSLKSIGFDALDDQLIKIAKRFADIRKEKEALNKVGNKAQDPAQLAAITNQLQALSKEENELANKIKITISQRKTQVEYERQYGETAGKTSARVLTEFAKLNKAYKEAKENAESLALEYGKDSDEAIKAAEAANVYYLKLKDINDAVKGRVQAPQAIPAPAVQIPVEAKDTKLAYDTYTGTIAQNLTTLVENEAALAANKAAQKALTDEIKAAGTPTQDQTLRLVQLREEAAVLANQNRDLSTTIGNQVKEFNASAGSIDQMQAQLNNLQNSYERLSLSERETPFGKELKAEIDVLEPKVKELEASLGKFNRNVGNYPKGSMNALKAEIKDLTNQYNNLTAAERKSEQGIGLKGQIGKVTEELASLEKKSNSVFTKIGGYLRSAVNYIPNFGYGGLVLLLLTPFEAAAAKIQSLFSSTASKAGESLKDLSIQSEKARESMIESAKAFEDAFVQVGHLRNEVDLAKAGFIDKNKVVNEYNETIGKTIGKVSDLNGVEQALVDNGDNYVKMMLYKAAATYSLEEAAKKAFEAQKTALTPVQEFTSIFDFLGSNLTSTDAGKNAEDDAKRRKQQANRRKEAVDDANKEKNELLGIAENFTKQAADIAKQFNFDFFGGQFDDKKNKERADSLTIAEQNAIKLIDSFNALALIRENKRVADIQKVRELSADEEIQHLKNLQQINQQYDEQRIRAVVGNNTAEQKFREEHQLKIVTDEIDTSKKIVDIRQKEYEKTLKFLKDRYDQESNLLKKRLEANEAAANLDNDTVQQSPVAGEEQKAIAARELNLTLIQITEKYYDDLETAARNNGQQLEVIAEEKDKRLIDLKRRGLILDANITKGYLKDIETASANQQNDRLVKDGAAIEKLYENRKLTTRQREAELQKIKVKYDSDELKRLQDLAKKELPILKALYDSQLISAEEYYKRLKELQDAITNATKQKSDDSKGKGDDLLTTAAFQAGQGLQGLASSIESALQIDPDSVAGAVIGDSFQFAETAMNSYFDNEANRIQQSLKLSQKRLDIETQQRLSRAQSQAEEDAINKQAAEQKEDLERKAFEQNKKLQIKQAKITFAIELANLAASAAANVANGATFGAAGAIQFAIQSTIAAARYALTVGNINAQQFAQGGRVQPVSLSNGRINTAPNIPMQRNGDNVLATVRVGEVILNEVQQRRLGGARVLREIGVPGFATGGIVQSSSVSRVDNHLLAPDTSFLNNPSVVIDIDRIVEKLEENNKRLIDFKESNDARNERIKAYVVTREMTEAQRKEARQNRIGTL